MANGTDRFGRAPESLRRLGCLCGALGLLLACADEPGPAARAEIAAREGVTHAMIGTPAPAFVGDSLTPGGWLPLAGLRTTPIAVLFFHPGGPSAAELVREFDRFRLDPSMAPTRFLGIVRDTPEAIQQFQRVRRSELPILRDPGSISRSYDIGATPTIVLIDVDHIVRFRLDGYVGAEFRPRLEATAAALRELPRQRAAESLDIRLEYGEFERLPDLLISAPEGGTVHLVETRGRATAILFLDAGCSWCGERLSAIMDSVSERDPGETGAVVVVIDPPDERTIQRLQRISPRFRVLVDRRRATAIRFPQIEAPELLLVDREGFIRYRAPRDLDDDAFEAEFRLHLAGVHAAAPPAAREPAPFAPLDARVPHVGDDACRECHQAQYAQWRATPHAAAITRLVQAGRTDDESCSPCHTTGAGLTGGFGHPLATASMTNVQCEACHGPGFDHVSAPPEMKRQTIYGLTGDCSGCDIGMLCAGCHDAANDPDFDLASALPKVTH